MLKQARSQTKLPRRWLLLWMLRQLELASLYIQNGQSSIFAVVSNGDSYQYQGDKEVSSVVNRLILVMLDNM